MSSLDRDTVFRKLRAKPENKVSLTEGSRIPLDLLRKLAYPPLVLDSENNLYLRDPE